MPLDAAVPARTFANHASVLSFVLPKLSLIALLAAASDFRLSATFLLRPFSISIALFLAAASACFTLSNAGKASSLGALPLDILAKLKASTPPNKPPAAVNPYANSSLSC